MNHQFKNKLSKGFTLIELLVVIAIIGILASIVLVSLGSARGKGRDAKRVADLSQILNAVEIDSKAGTANTLLPATAGNCGAANVTGALLNTCSDPNLATFNDPVNSASATLCASGVSSSYSACNYTISAASSFGAAAKFTDWQVKTSLEVGTGDFGPGTVCISSATSTITNVGCR